MMLDVLCVCDCVKMVPFSKKKKKKSLETASSVSYRRALSKVETNIFFITD